MLRHSGYYFAGGLVLAGLAFWPGYGARLGSGDLSPYIHVHAATMTAWFALLIAQPFLIRADRRAIHRALGRLSYVIAPMVVATSLVLVHRGLVATAPGDLFAARFAYLPISMACAYAITYGLAIGYRRTTALHARFIVGSALALVDPIASRVAFSYLPELPRIEYYPAVSLAITAVVLIVLIARDRQRQGRRAYAVVAAVFAVVYLGWFALSPSAAWRGFAAWFRDLPLP